MSQQAHVTLTAITPGMKPLVRRLDLNPKHISIPIGRASKSIQKGLVGAENNAWFDSPVMSREHAELILDEDNVCIMIQDNSSMHGTAINGVKIPVMVPQKLNKHDRLEFGTVVRRGPEEYPACEFEIDWDIRQWSPGFAVSVPESSDMEDNDYSEEENHDSPNSLTPNESPDRKPVSCVPDTIDLTKEDSDEEIEVETYTGPAGLSEEDASRDREAMGHGMLHAHIGEDLEGGDEGPDPGFSYWTIDESAPGENADAEEDLDFSELEAELEAMDSSVYDSSSDSDSNKENDEESELDAEFDMESDREKSDIGSVDGLAENQPHDFGDDEPLSDSYTAAFSALKEPTSINVVSTESSCLRPTPIEDCEEIPESNLRTMVKPNPPSQQPADVIMNFSSNSSAPPSVEYPRGPRVRNFQMLSSFEKYPANNNAIERQPSPSDAAMVKRSASVGGPLPLPSSLVFPVPTLIRDTAQPNPVPVHHMPSSAWQQFTSRTFADKPQKQEFFQAREQNRATVNARFEYQPPTYSVCHSSMLPSAHFMTASEEPTGSMGIKETFPPLAIPSKTSGSTFGQVVPAENVARQWGATSSTVLGKTTQSDEEDFPLPNLSAAAERYFAPKDNGEYDMTSAVAFNKSKASQELPVTVKKPRFSPKAISRPLKRSALVQQSTDANLPLKRKADQISNVVEDELHAWGAVNSATVEDTSTAIPVSTSEDALAIAPESQEIASKIMENQPVVVSQDLPNKRLKTIAEKVGYFALGSLTAGAALFSVLVATAPEFL